MREGKNPFNFGANLYPGIGAGIKFSAVCKKKLTFLMWSFRKAIPRYGGAHHLKHKVIWVRWFCQQWDHPIELKERARPAMNHYQRNGTGSLWNLLWLHMHIMDINAWMEFIKGEWAQDQLIKILWPRSKKLLYCKLCNLLSTD